MANLIKEEVSYADFNSLGRKMNTVLAMLGATEQEKKDVMAAINRNQAAILAEEQVHVKIATTDEAKITLDLSGMREPSRRIAAQLQDDLRAALPNDLAEALVNSMDTDRYYFHGESNETSFRITRGESGGLMATQATGGGSTGSGIQPQLFPDDGSAIPAASVFDVRWKKWLDGKSLHPPGKP